MEDCTDEKSDMARVTGGCDGIRGFRTALSHHSHAMFDHNQEVTVTGTVTVMSFRNPHVFLYVDVEEENGETVNYWIEMSNLPNMIRRGIGVNTFKAG